LDGSGGFCRSAGQSLSGSQRNVALDDAASWAGALDLMKINAALAGKAAGKGRGRPTRATALCGRADVGHVAPTFAFG
jgi:hypothetical protein